RVVKRCLAKDPEDRWQTAQDLVSEVKWIAEDSGATIMAAAQPSSRPWAWMVAGVFAFTTALLAIIHFREAPPKASAIRFTVSPPEKTRFGGGDFPALSPDGERLAFTATGEDGKRQLYVRPLGSLATQALPGTDGASSPFWSPDSRYVAYLGDGK